MDTNEEPNETRDLIVEYGRQLAAERARAGWTLDELSKRSGISRESLHRYEHGQREIRLGDMRRVARALGTTVDRMVTEAEYRAEHGAPPAPVTD